MNENEIEKLLTPKKYLLSIFAGGPSQVHRFATQKDGVTYILSELPNEKGQIGPKHQWVSQDVFNKLME